MKDIYKKNCILGMLALLIMSCSLLKPLPENKTLQSSSQISKPELLSQSVTNRDVLHCVVTTGYEEGLVNLRAGTGVTFDVLLVLRENDKLKVLENGDWLKVMTADGVVGYINSKYCKLGE